MSQYVVFYGGYWTEEVKVMVALYHRHGAKIVGYSAIIAPLDGFEYRNVLKDARAKLHLCMTDCQCLYFNDPETQTR